MVKLRSLSAVSDRSHSEPAVFLPMITLFQRMTA